MRDLLHPFRKGDRVVFDNRGHRVRGVVSSATRTHITIEANGRHHRRRTIDVQPDKET